MKLTAGYIVLALFFLISFGCAGNSPTRYYVLNPVGANSAPGQQANCITIGVGPVKIPEYLNRTQIVTRNNPNELELTHFDLWAEPLLDAVPRILGENLSRLLCTKEVMLFPWKTSQSPDHRVEIDVIRMDGVPGKTADLEAWWSVTKGGDIKSRLSKRSALSEPVTAPGFAGLVSAHSRALENLSREIAGTIQNLQ